MRRRCRANLDPEETMRFPKRPLLALLAVASTGLSAPVLADSVSGRFELEGKAVEPAHVAAFRIRDQSDPYQHMTYVMLTASPVQRDAIAAATDPYAVAINDPAASGTDYLSFSVDGSGEVQINARVDGVQYVDSSGRIMGQQGSLSADCTSNTAERVVCTVRTTKPVKTMSGPTWTLDVSFDSEVRGRKPGKPVARGGGDPGKALMALVQALDGDDLDAILALLSAGRGEMFRASYNTPEENLVSAKSFLDHTVPKQPKIASGEHLADDHVILEVEGTPYEDTRMLYLVEMKREEGRWVMDASRVAGFLR